MDKLKKDLNALMDRIKKENPNANWKNLITGLVILVLLGLFSIWYFSSNSQNSLIEELAEEGNSVTINTERGGTEATQEVTETGADATNATEVKPQGDLATISVDGTTTVQAGEGLWHVAKRVCGDGEKYVYLAEENGLNMWSELAAGQTLKVSCGTK